jgi:hypothetical protein
MIYSKIPSSEKAEFDLNNYFNIFLQKNKFYRTPEGEIGKVIFESEEILTLETNNFEKIDCLKKDSYRLKRKDLKEKD